MFYKMIENARDRWYASAECTIKSMTDYIELKGMLRDAQINAIKTYLFLKISCESRSLADLFSEGKFNTLDLEGAEISNTVRRYLEQNTAAAALFEYSCLKNDQGEQVSKKLEELIKKAPENIDYRKFFRDWSNEYVYGLFRNRRKYWSKIFWKKKVYDLTFANFY